MKLSDKYNLTIGCECETRFTGEDEGCCGICVDICPEVFEISNNSVIIKRGVDIDRYEKKIMTAIENCPVEAIILSKRRNG